MNGCVSFHPASPSELEAVWAYNIAAHPGDRRWEAWREDYIALNRAGLGRTWVVTVGDEIAGEGTLLFDPSCGAVGGRLALADGRTRANLNALRMKKAYEGRGLMSGLTKAMEARAKARGFGVMTIGVEEKERRNRAIYRHWGYVTPLFEVVEDGERVLYYEKTL